MVKLIGTKKMEMNFEKIRHDYVTEYGSAELNKRPLIFILMEAKPACRHVAWYYRGFVWGTTHFWVLLFSPSHSLSTTDS